jgi:hypothetical protein
MDKVYLRHLFEINRDFLKQVYESQNKNKIITSANDNCLDILIRILHLIATGQITLRKDDQEIIIKSRRMKKLELFESKKYFSDLLRNSRETKLLVLKQFISIYSVLLYSFFNII